MLSTGIEINYETAPFYGFYLGVDTTNGSPLSDDDKAKRLYDKECGQLEPVRYLKAILGISFLIQMVIGRQYVNMPLVAGNYTRAFKESFEGLSVVNKSIKDNLGLQLDGFIPLPEVTQLVLEI